MILYKLKKFFKRSKEYAILKKQYEKINLGNHSFQLNVENFVFWKKAEIGSWEPQTYQILDKFLTRDSIYYDIGAWIGPTVLYASKICKQAICFEPDPVAYRHLINNIHQNKIDNIKSYNFAVSSSTGLRNMASFGSSVGDSMSSLVNPNKEVNGFIVAAFGWDDISNCFNFDSVDFIKIDIEGGEFDLIPAMKTFIVTYRPIILLSLHVPYIPEAERLDSLKKIIEILSIYEKCLNSSLDVIDISELLSQTTQTGFPSFLFKD